MPPAIQVVREPISLDDLRAVAAEQVINVRPTRGNRSRSVVDPALQARIREVVSRLVRE